MTDDQFRILCNTYGFAPSRALRELLDAATAQAQPIMSGPVEAPATHNFFVTALENGGVARFEFCSLVDVEKAKLAVEAACDVIDGPVAYEPPRGLFDAVRRWWS